MEQIRIDGERESLGLAVAPRRITSAHSESQTILITIFLSESASPEGI